MPTTRHGLTGWVARTVGSFAGKADASGGGVGLLIETYRRRRKNR